MHGIQGMNFFSFGTLLGSNVFLQKSQSYQQNFVKLSLPDVSIGFKEIFQYIKIYPFYQSLGGHFWVFFHKIFVFGQIGNM